MAANDRAGAGPCAAVALLGLGQALILGGRPESARDVLRQASQRAETLAMPRVAADAGRLLGATA